MDAGTYKKDAYRVTRSVWLLGVIAAAVMLCLTVSAPAQQRVAEPTETETAEQFQRRAREEAAEDYLVEPVQTEIEGAVSRLPEDASRRFTVSRIRITGNLLVTTERLIEEMPEVYNASAKPMGQADSDDLYDLRTIRQVMRQPGQTREVSVRMIQGLTQYIIAKYQSVNYAGIYAYVPSDVLTDELPGGVLPVHVIEARVDDVAAEYFTPENLEAEKTYLKKSALMKWSPAKSGEVINRKKLDDFVNLLNLNPDRYVSAVVSKGDDPNTLDVGYNIYEASPWHSFIQLDNSGTQDREWVPRMGVINTNLLGFDDAFTAVYQAPFDSEMFEHYSIYGSYDFPVTGPRTRLNLFGGYSEFDVNPDTGDVDFIGNGVFYGGTLRFNAMQHDGWFFDVTGTLMHEESKVTPSIFPQFLGSDVEVELWGWGLDFHKRDDLTNSSVRFQRMDSYSGSDQAEFNLARTNADRNFSVYTTSINHSRFLARDKIHRLSGSFKWVTSDERLIPSRMTSFGGMYSVRGYDEYEIVADGGLLVSGQYEYDIVARQKAGGIGETEDDRKPLLRKLAPLCFIDYGQARIEDPIAGEHRDQELMSVGTGVIIELGDNFTGAMYYGYPLTPTENTRTGDGRMNVGFMMRW